MLEVVFGVSTDIHPPQTKGASMEYLVFCTFDIEGVSANETQSRATYNEIYEALKGIGLGREYPVLPRGLSLGMAGGLGQGLMRGMGTTILSAPVETTTSDLPSTSVVGRISAVTPLAAARKVRTDVEGIFKRKRLKGRAFVIAAANEECDRFVF